MPSVSKKQKRFMAAAAHNPRFAKKAGIKQSVAKDFFRADQGALKRAVGGSVRGRPMKDRQGLSGALRRIAPQGQKDPSQRAASRGRMGNHMYRASQDVGTEADAALAETGEGLRGLMNRVSSRMGRRGGRQIVAARGGKIRKYAEGGKVGAAMSALRALAKKYQEAMDSGDTMLARRLRRQLDAAGVEDTEKKLGNEKAKTFAKGGKVKKFAKAVLARMDDLEGYVREGKGRTRKEAYESLRKQVAEDNGENVADAVLEEHGITYKRSRE